MKNLNPFKFWRKEMSVSATRRVGTSTSSPRAERGYSANGQNSQFVEYIDTQNNVLVRDETNEHHRENNEYQRQNKKDEQQQEFSSSNAYVHNSVSAIAASGVLETEAEYGHTSRNIGVYDTNQSIIRDEELERTGRNYLKHFYEKNEHLMDIDKLI